MVVVTKHLLDAFMACCVGRRDDYAYQRSDGRYYRAGCPLTYDVVYRHLQGVQTIGSYLIDEYGLCRFAVFDSDASSGLVDLLQAQMQLAGAGVPSYLEQSRRGAHLRVFFRDPASPALARRWLLPFCPSGVEFYPKQDALSESMPLGSLVRLPLGVHRLTGECYPFVTWSQGQFVPVAASLADMLAWFSTVQRAPVPASAPSLVTDQAAPTTPRAISFNPVARTDSAGSSLTIRDWCNQQDPVAIISRYVQLDQRGLGCCPFGAHHDDGVDTHPSFRAYYPTYPDICCWYCHVWRQGGSLFDFLRYYYGLSARDLWSHILAGGHF
ncbi:TOTE conflict system archaeo-eukaryotic primase domain-containing protein [Dictyobacter formicarum]|uniref:TOTE conflict system primase domain-containing protein n=1 Tax=Dictyobacter formicarum TaxID=2778368 RepID=A0ABQ3VR11_9CHLR|nr:hypothetical protein [Dictyobacter formicarum]GHO88312.1 hypothetical protein KSZ_63180 [Dictyobacter formicarum]